ncbi:MAG: hypothetical protein A2139_14760, partial [Desulfobacca sp. RBG_16_60_12]
MKVLFLDVDGVLNHSRCPEWNNGDWRVLDQVCVHRVRRICEETGAKIVLSSTWRLDEEGVALLVEQFGDLIISKTPAKFSWRPRWQEIKEWLEDNGPVEVACVIDDDPDAELHGVTFVRTSFEMGGLNRHAEKRVL